MKIIMHFLLVLFLFSNTLGLASDRLDLETSVSCREEAREKLKQVLQEYLDCYDGKDCQKMEKDLAAKIEKYHKVVDSCEMEAKDKKAYEEDQQVAIPPARALFEIIWDRIKNRKQKDKKKKSGAL